MDSIQLQPFDAAQASDHGLIGVLQPMQSLGESRGVPAGIRPRSATAAYLQKVGGHCVVFTDRRRSNPRFRPFSSKELQTILRIAIELELDRDFTPETDKVECHHILGAAEVLLLERKLVVEDDRVLTMPGSGA